MLMDDAFPALLISGVDVSFGSEGVAGQRVWWVLVREYSFFIIVTGG
jgi:hypothetical protein